MSQNPTSQNKPPYGRPKPSPAPHQKMGLKLVLICGLILLMAIPAMFISYISYERAGRADEVTREVAQRYGGAQTVMGPLLVAPYAVRGADGEVIETGDYVVFAQAGHAAFDDLKTTVRKRSLFKVPTYQGTGTITADFGPIGAQTLKDARTGLSVDWDAAQLIISISDVRGLKTDITLTDRKGESHNFEPATALSNVTLSKRSLDPNPRISSQYLRHGGYQSHLSGRLMMVPAKNIVSPTSASTVSVNIELGGASSLSVLPFARSTTTSIGADWADPGFSGAFPPLSRDITEAGFSAQWFVPRLARSLPAQGFAHALPLHEMDSSAMQVNFIDTQSAYKTVNRSLKYAVLFIGLVFLAYFLFEVIVGVSVHPAQYILIGLAQSIFYLLLLAFSEHIGFKAAFMVAAGATILASAGYAGAVFGDRAYIGRVGLVFVLVYGLLFVLMQMADFALMIGALTAFIAIAGTMYLTRNVNWYGGSPAPQTRIQI